MRRSRSSPVCHLRILCAFADSAQRRSLLGVLAGPGRTIECVADAEQALTCLARRPRAWDLVLTAHELPRSGGVAFVRRMRAAGFAGRIIVLCAEATKRIVSAYRALGVTALRFDSIALGLLRAAVAGPAEVTGDSACFAGKSGCVRGEVASPIESSSRAAAAGPTTVNRTAEM